MLCCRKESCVQLGGGPGALLEGLCVVGVPGGPGLGALQRAGMVQDGTG